MHLVRKHTTISKRYIILSKTERNFLCWKESNETKVFFTYSRGINKCCKSFLT